MEHMETIISDIKKFIVEANKAGYAAGDSATIIKEADGSKTIVYEKGDWKYHDNFFGGEPYGGREVVFYKGKPVWMMVYYGWVIPNIDPKTISPFLQESLRLIPEDSPFRGPKLHESANMHYINEWKGQADSFKGEEIILLDKKEVYKAFYVGGLVDQR